MVEHDIQDYLHALCVRCINQVLKFHILTLIALIHFREVAGVIAVIVIARSILHHRSNPYSCKTECLDVVQFLNQALEVATPCRVAYVVVLRVPTLGIVTWITIVETGGHHKINLLIAEIRATREQCGSNSAYRYCTQRQNKEKLLHISNRNNCYSSGNSGYPTAPSKLTCSSFCASTANSIGSLSITSLA